MIAVGFTGHWKVVDAERCAKLEAAMRRLLAHHFRAEVVLHHGDCIGMDAYAHELALKLGFETAIHPPDDDSRRAFCKGSWSAKPRPYLKRNEDIVDASVMLLACPPDPEKELLRDGAWATVRYARRNHVPIALI